MRLFASVVVLSVALTTSVSARPAPDQPTAQPTAAAAKDGDKKMDGVVCRKETPTGSHFPVKVCTTAEQRKAQRASAQKAQESLQGPTQVVPN